MEETLARLGSIGLVPVIKLAEAAKAPGLGRALVAGGIPVAEVTFRTAAAPEAIRRLRAEVPGLLVGAGTVLDRAQAESALAAGASFVVSPGFDDGVVDLCRERGLPVLPGVACPDGVMRGIAKGLEVLKFFPAEAAGGLPMIDALAGPFSSMRFVPTGGIDAANLGSWARRSNVLAVGGSWMAPSALIEAEDWASIERLCREAVLALHGFAFAHLGLNNEDEESCRRAAALFSELFGFVPSEGSSSIFQAERSLEVMKKPYLGAHGHLAILCNDVERAVARFAGLGIGTRPETAAMDKGRLKAIYLDLEISGFALHLLRAS